MSNPNLVLLELPAPSVPTHESWSPFCVKVHRALRLLGLPYERRFVARPDRLAHHNPKRQVPVLLVDGEPVFDSSAILKRLERIAGIDLAPREPRLAAEAWLYEELADTAVNGFLVAARWADDRNWPATREAYFGSMPSLVRAIVPARLRARVVATLRARDVWRGGPEECWARFEELLDRLDARAPKEGPWVGERHGAADVALFGQLHSLRSPLTPWQRDRVAARPNLSSWLDRVDALTSVRPATAMAA